MARKPQQPGNPGQEDKPQQQTLSVRISEALRMRLERARQLLSSKTGESVSTSEIAKQLLESAREDRLEVVDLLEEPTQVMVQIRRKGEAQQPLSRAEWTVLAHFIQQGLEVLSTKMPGPVSRESVLGILDAFLAAYELRTNPESGSNHYYLENLPKEFRPAPKKGEPKDAATSEMVRRTVAETRKQLTDPHTEWIPRFIGRNLFVLFEDDKLAGPDALNRALRPYWPVLWRVAARGHFASTDEPVRDIVLKREHLYRQPIPSIREGKYTLSFARGEASELSLLLSFPGVRGPTYPISGYPKITEFRRMLATLTRESVNAPWTGGYFFGFLAEREPDKEKEFWFRAHENGITFGFSEEEWESVQELFRRAWEIPEVRMAWDALTTEYGEL